MAYNYTVCNRDQLYLRAPSMKDWLREDHFMWFLLDAIEQMYLSVFYAAHRRDGKGQKARHPEMFVQQAQKGKHDGKDGIDQKTKANGKKVIT